MNSTSPFCGHRRAFSLSNLPLPGRDKARSLREMGVFARLGSHRLWENPLALDVPVSF